MTAHPSGSNKASQRFNNFSEHGNDVGSYYPMKLSQALTKQ